MRMANHASGLSSINWLNRNLPAAEAMVLNITNTKSSANAETSTVNLTITTYADIRLWDIITGKSHQDINPHIDAQKAVKDVHS